jgi:hypothetical protein
MLDKKGFMQKKVIGKTSTAEYGCCNIAYIERI